MSAPVIVAFAHEPTKLDGMTIPDVLLDATRRCQSNGDVLRQIVPIQMKILAAEGKGEPGVELSDKEHQLLKTVMDRATFPMAAPVILAAVLAVDQAAPPAEEC